MGKNTLPRLWKEYTKRLIMRRFGTSISQEKVDKYLDNLLDQKMQAPACFWVNNYKRAVVNTDALQVIDQIVDNDLIVGGGATTYAQHASSDNPFLKYIEQKAAQRSHEKRQRSEHERGTAEWAMYDIKQGNVKIIMNSLYGVLGYARFIFHNIFLAESITRMGRCIIATASCGFENFLCDNIHFATESEVYEYLDTIISEYDEKYQDKDFTEISAGITVENTVSRILKKAGFEVSDDTRRHVLAIVSRCTPGCLTLLYYKNNFMEFNRIPCIKAKIMRIIEGIPHLQLPEIDKIEDPEVRDEVANLWNLYEIFVFFEHPIYDAVRKMAYGTRKAVLYIDTDSNFISLARWVEQIQNEFFAGSLPHPRKECTFVCANVLTIFLSTVVDKNLKLFARNTNISELWQKKLSMKNEFFFWRILFGDVKKRYIDLQMIQEGKLINNGDGMPEIKGYDFRKFTVKSRVRDYYTEMCLKRILTPEHIDLRLIYRDIDTLKRDVIASMRRGESEFFKQANVNRPEHYANPLRISGIKAVMLWNAIAPEYAIQLPVDVDIIPIRNISIPKYGEPFKQAYPKEYARFEREILLNRNPDIAKMQCNVIAKPKNVTEMPPWLLSIMDTATVVNSTIKLINPIVEHIGLKVARPTATKEYLTNMVDL